MPVLHNVIINCTFEFQMIFIAHTFPKSLSHNLLLRAYSVTMPAVTELLTELASVSALQQSEKCNQSTIICYNFTQVVKIYFFLLIYFSIKVYLLLAIGGNIHKTCAHCCRKAGHKLKGCSISYLPNSSGLISLRRHMSVFNMRRRSDMYCHLAPLPDCPTATLPCTKHQRITCALLMQVKQ